jgi:RimJ/RimL family protein N-acetyltransferase
MTLSVSPSALRFSYHRILLRHLHDADLDDMVAIFSNPNVSRWMGDGKALNRSQCQHWIEKSQHNYHHYGYGAFAVIETNSGNMIGCGGLVHPGGQEACEIIYALKEAVWGQGFGHDMVAGILKLGIEKCHINRIIATVDPDNFVSIRLLETNGMRYVETQPDEDGMPTAIYHIDVNATASS